MELILSKQCESLTGCLGRGYGYFVQRRRGRDGSIRFFSQRSKHPPIPREGHLRFIFLCADLTKMRLHIADVRVQRGELVEALSEAGLKKLAENVRENPDPLRAVLTADDIIDFKNKHNL